MKNKQLSSRFLVLRYYQCLSGALIAIAAAIAVPCSYGAGERFDLLSVRVQDGDTIESLGLYDWYSTTATAEWLVTNLPSNAPGGLGNRPVIQYLNARRGDTPAQVTSTTLSAFFTPTDFSENTLTLSFDLGWLWGQETYSASPVYISLLDENGNGYRFINRRSDVGWAIVTNGVVATPTYVDINSSQVAVMGGVLPGFIITRSIDGDWIFTSELWSSALGFNDTRYSSFSELQFSTNPYGDYSISLILDNIELVANVPEPATVALLLGAALIVPALARARGRYRYASCA